MPLFWKHYQSEVTQFITELKAKRPSLEAEQRAGRALLWDLSLIHIWVGRITGITHGTVRFQCHPEPLAERRFVAPGPDAGAAPDTRHLGGPAQQAAQLVGAHTGHHPVEVALGQHLGPASNTAVGRQLDHVGVLAEGATGKLQPHAALGQLVLPSGLTQALPHRLARCAGSQVTGAVLARTGSQSEGRRKEDDPQSRLHSLRI